MNSAPSVAAGALAVAVGLLTVGSALVIAHTLWPTTETVDVHCESSVEIDEPDGLRLGCIGSDELRACDGARAGDRVKLEDNQCIVLPGGMSAGVRLMLGLPLDLNRVSAEDLQLIDGIGPSLANAIVEYRARAGSFRSVHELDRVNGIGPKVRAKISPYVATGPSSVHQRRSESR